MGFFRSLGRGIAVVEHNAVVVGTRAPALVVTGAVLVVHSAKYAVHEVHAGIVERRTEYKAPRTERVVQGERIIIATA